MSAALKQADERVGLVLESPLQFLRRRGYRIERADGLQWWRLDPPAGSERKTRLRCSMRAIVAIANAEGWVWKASCGKARNAVKDADRQKGISSSSS